jgi:hypothetical protein
MDEATRRLILERIGDDDVVLDIGGWADPFERADWVMDLGSYDTRGFYKRMGWKEPGPRPPERFSERTWLRRDICDRRPYPFGDKTIDFVLCVQTLEDVRDPVWVCSEINRIAKAGYIEVPSRLEEQSWGVEGPFVGRRHHHWLINVRESEIEFVFKPHDIHSSPERSFPAGFFESLNHEERVERLWWKGTFSYRERVFSEADDWGVDYPSELVSRELAVRKLRVRPRVRMQRLLTRLLRRP